MGQKLTPMMAQYQAIKDQYPDAFLFYRLGDFYELFNEDAEKGAQILELTLTTRSHSAENPIPMCGVPHKAVDSYIDLLIEKGYKVAICEQMEDPKKTKGMVKRAVTRLITPGTQIDQNGDAARSNNYLAALVENEHEYDVAYADLATGELKTTSFASVNEALNEIINLQTKEIVTADQVSSPFLTPLQKRGILFSKQPEILHNAEVSYLTQDLTHVGQKQVVSQLVSYLLTTQKRSLDHLQKAIAYEPNAFMKIDHYSKTNLELTANIRSGKRKGTLVWLLDETQTAMGSRLLKQWLDRPLINLEQIKKRQAKVQVLLDSYFERSNLQAELTKVYDLERLAGRVAYGNVNGRDLIQLKTSLLQVPKIKYILDTLNTVVFDELNAQLDPLTDIAQLIDDAINPDAPISVTDGGVIKDGYSQQLDQYRDAMNNGKQWIAQLQAKERELTGINNLKIGYNHVFGYYIEVTKANLAKLPPDRYERKQTLTNAERFATPELKEKEALILEAQEKSTALEYELFVQVRETIKQAITRLQALAKALAQLDVLQSFAVVSENYHFVCPTLNQGHNLAIKNGRHPVVEKVMGHQEYVPNDVLMDEKTSILLITGPNMSGKSTYMRQLALTAVLAQMGCFVPADEAELPIFDQIFTRIGAADDLIAGESTFMVEMMEANNALQNASDRSLILFDEIGRGTATYDGMALAQAIIEYVHDHVQAKTLFSTHYHELTDLEKSLPRLHNVHVGATETNGELVFLHQIKDGPADKSYGIHVAKLAGMPNDLLDRADKILGQLENQAAIKITTDEDIQPKAPETVEKTPELEEANGQLELFAPAPSAKPKTDPTQQQILKQLQSLNLMGMTPMEIMNQVYEWQTKLAKQK